MSLFKLNSRALFGSIIIALFFLCLILPLMPNHVQGNPDWLTSWQYRKSNVISGATGAGTSYQVKIKVHYSAPVLGAWTVKQPIPTGVGDAAYGVYNDRIYVIGGYGVSPSDYRNNVQVYDPSSNSWTSKTPMPTARWGPMAVCAGNKIYVFGGLTSGGMTNKLEVYDPSSDTWDTSKSPMPYALRCGGCVYDPDNGLIYIIGGNNGPQLTKIFSYNPSSDTYDTSLTDCPQRVEGATCAYKDGKIYVIGGLDDSQSGENRDLKVNRVYTISSNSWSTRTDAPERREGQSGYTGPSIMGDYIYYTHGMRRGISPVTFYKTNFRYQISTDAWQQLADAFYERDGCGSAVVNGKLYIIAGRKDTAGLQYVEEFDPNALVGDSGENVYLNGHCKVDFGDVRFTDDDGTTLLDYWIEEKVDSDYATFWAEVKDDLGSAQTVYIYYGKGDATATSNGDNTFLFFDDFLGTSLDATKWDQIFSPTVTVSDSVVSVKQTTQTADLTRIQGKTGFGTQALRTKVKFQYPSTSTQWSQAGLASGTASIPDGCWFEDTNNALLTIAWEGGHVSHSSIGYQSNVFQVYEITYQPNIKAKFYSNDALKDTETTNIPNGNLSPFLGVYNNLVLTTYADWVLVRKYVDPEPSHGVWGAEETAVPEYTLTIHSSPTGVTFTADGGSHTTSWSGTYGEGTTVSLEMPSIHTAGEATYHWDTWSDAVTTRSRTVTMDSDITLTAHYTGPYYLVETATGTGTATFESDVGTIQDLTAIDEGTLPPEGKPDLLFPHGFFSFKVTGLSLGQTAKITTTLPFNMPVGTQYWKCQWGTVWYEIPIDDDDGDNVIIIHVTDGGVGDADGLPNGVIIDPGAPGTPLPSPPVGVIARYDLDDEIKENDPTIGTEFTTAMYGAVAASDNIYAVTRVLHTYDYSQQIFKFDIGADAVEFTVAWEGNIAFKEAFLGSPGPHYEGIVIWRAAGSWEYLGNVSQVGDFYLILGPDPGPSVQGRLSFMKPDEVISKTYTTNVNDYITDGHVYVMVWAKNSHDATISTDCAGLAYTCAPPPPPPPAPPPVGGEWVPINKSALLAPWITLASLMTIVTVSFVYVERKKKQQK